MILGYLKKWADEADNGLGSTDEEWINACKEAQEESKEEPFRGTEMGFFKYPADIDPWEPITLRDADVLQGEQKSFEEMCKEFENIFSKDSSDLGDSAKCIPLGKPYSNSA